MTNRSLPPWLVAGAAVSLLVGTAGRSNADTLTVDFADSGWYVQDGFHSATIKNYLAGLSTGNVVLRNYFVFDLTGVTDPIVGARLRLFNPADGFTGAPRDYTLFDVSTPVPTLTAGSPQGSATGRAIFDDLGSGTPEVTARSACRHPNRARAARQSRGVRRIGEVGIALGTSGSTPWTIPAKRQKAMSLA